VRGSRTHLPRSSRGI